MIEPEQPESNNPIEEFLYAIGSPMTKRRYLKNLDHFLDFVGMKGTTLEDKAASFLSMGKRKGEKWIIRQVIRYMTFQKERAERKEISESSIKNYYKPIKLFLEMNDIVLFWKKITRGIPKARRFAADRAPTIEEIRRIAEYPDRRIKAILCTMCSSGIRVGAWDYLRWKDVVPIKGGDDTIIAAKLVVYAEDPEQYDSLITPEAYHELKKWMDYRESYGEKITGDSWLMRDLWNVQKFSRGMVTAPKKLKSSGVKRLIERALRGQGIRGPLPEGKRRHEFQTDHGFRKFFKTHAEQSMRPINVETLMGHSTGVSDSYYRPNEKELLQDYLNAVPDITIMSDSRQKLKLAQQEQRIAALEHEQRKVEHLEYGVNLLGALMAEQKTKNGILHELEHPTHHHTTKQIKNLKQFALSPPLQDNWKLFTEWSKRGPHVYGNNSKE